MKATDKNKTRKKPNANTISYRPPEPWKTMLVEEVELEGSRTCAGLIHRLVVMYFRNKHQAEALIHKKDVKILDTAKVETSS